MPRRERDLTRLLIISEQRSGSTLLASLLNSQDRCTVLSDWGGFFLTLAINAGGFNAPLARRQRNIALAAAKWELRTTDRRLSLGPNDFATLDELHRAVMDTIADPDTLVVGHKVTHAVAYLPQILAQTDWKCLFVMRDVRDQMYSLWNWYYLSIDQAIASWKETSRMIRGLQPHPRLAVIRFEELISDPPRTVVPISHLLGLPIRTDFSELKYNNASFTNNSALHDIRHLFDDRAVGRWKKCRHQPVVRYAAWACQRELAALGYEPFGQPFSLSETARFTRRYAASFAFGGWRRFRQRAKDLLFPPFTSP